jgi:hypothetical protein
MPVTNLFGQNRNNATQQGHNLGNQGWSGQSPMRSWLDNFQPDQMGWGGGSGGGAPGHLGQDFNYNARTGESGYNNRAGASYEDINTPGGNSIWRIDPKTGDKVINIGGLRSMMGGNEGGGYEGYGMTEYGGEDIAPGEGWGGYEYKDAMVDPSAAIAAQEYQLQDNMQGDFAKAGGRAGASGFDMSTPYMAELGDAARKASQDRNAIAMQYQYDASSDAADREQQQEMQAAQSAFGGWQTGYQGGMQADMFNASNEMDRWGLENQIGLQNNQGMNQYNQQNEYMNQNNMSNIIQQMLMGT